MDPARANLKTRVFDPFAWRPHPSTGRILRREADQDGFRLLEFLSVRTSAELSSHDIRSEIAGNLWMLSPEAFRYFLPAFLYASLFSYSEVSIFVSELVEALTEPSRSDVEETFDKVDRIPPGVGLSAEMTELLRRQQLQYFDSGTTVTTFHDRVDSLTPAEGAAVLDFFIHLRGLRGDSYPFGELQNAIDRHWARYRESCDE